MKVKAGDILISEPFLPDPNFIRTTVFIVEHNDEGTLGFVLNQAMDLTLKDVVNHEGGIELDIPLYNGGPVGSDTLHVIHQLGDHVKTSKYISNHVYWGGDFDQIQFLLGNQNANWKDFRFFIGYSGWAPGQLDAELEQNNWIISRGKAGIIFEEDPSTIWERLLDEKGGKYKLLKKSPLRPDWN